MFADTEPQSRRERPAKPALSRDAIIDAALELAQREGLGAVTLRALAQTLDTGPASLYVYIANRDELAARMLDRILAGVAGVPVKPKRWRRRLVELLTAMHGELARYPGIAEVLLRARVGGPGETALAVNAIGLLRAGGISAQAATRAWQALVLFTAANALAGADLDLLAVGLDALSRGVRDGAADDSD
jgi:AcrR family transcriptional regulator